MKLYFLRHGEADWPDWDKPDDERPLTKRGKEEMKKVAAFLAQLDVSLDHIVTSPLPRAEQTARVVAKELEMELKQDPALQPGFGISQLRPILKKYSGENLMIVGHEPDFSSTICDLTGADIKLSKAGVALVDLDDGAMHGRLLWLFPPRLPKAARP